MDINQLETFYHLAKNLNFSKVAKIMHLAQPSVTARIQNLENNLECTLFKRDGKNLTLTAEGEVLFEYTKQILPSIHEAKKAVKSINKPKLSVGFCPGFSQSIITNIIEMFISSTNSLLSINEDTPSFKLFNKVMSEEIDLAFIRNPYYNDSLVIEPIYKDSWEIFMSVHHPLNSMDTLSKDDLKGHTLITYENTDVWKKYEESFLGIHNLPRLEIKNIELLKKLVNKGIGFSFLPLLSLIDELNDHKICLKKLENFPDTTEDIYVIYKHNSFKTDLIKKFISIFNIGVLKRTKQYTSYLS